MRRFSLIPPYEPFHFFRQDRASVDLSRQQAADLLASGPAAIADAVAAVGVSDTADWIYLLPEHRHDLVMAAYGDSAARARLGG